jgi:hypothetical protein
MVLLDNDVSPTLRVNTLPLETIFPEHFQKMLAKPLKSKSKKHQSADKREVLDGHSLLDQRYRTIQEYIVHFPKNKKIKSLQS